MEENKNLLSEELIIEEENQEQLVPVYEEEQPEENEEVFTKANKVAIGVAAVTGIGMVAASVGFYLKKRKEAKVQKEWENYRNRLIESMKSEGLEQDKIDDVLRTLQKANDKAEEADK